MAEGLLHVHTMLRWTRDPLPGRLHHSLHPLVSAVTLAVNGPQWDDHLMISACWKPGLFLGPGEVN